MKTQRQKALQEKFTAMLQGAGISRMPRTVIVGTKPRYGKAQGKTEGKA